MGYAKYEEDDIKISDDRITMKHGSPFYDNAAAEYKPVIRYKYNCPFCKYGADNFENITGHVKKFHGGSCFVYVNDREIQHNEIIESPVFSLVLFYFGNESAQVRVKDNFDNEYLFNTSAGIAEYDIDALLEGKLFSELNIKIEGIPDEYLIIQKPDINEANINRILCSKYTSALFDYQVSEDELDETGCFIYLKMLIHEHQDISMFMERIEYLDFKNSKVMDELYLYAFLYSGEYEPDAEKYVGFTSEEFNIFKNILCGEYIQSESELKNIRNKNDYVNSLKLIIGLLQHDDMSADFLMNKCSLNNIVGKLIDILVFFKNYKNENLAEIKNNLNELSLFIKYPLVSSLIELSDAIYEGSGISSETYKMLRNLSPVAVVCYLGTLEDNQTCEKILKSTLKVHKDSQQLKNFAFDKSYYWLNKKLKISDGELYKKALYEKNKQREKPFTEEFLNSVPSDDNIEIKNIGGGRRIGASCILISCRGTNILLDAGIDPKKKGNGAYPMLDALDCDIDAVVITHAHIDHCGALPKVHAMWRNAKIICTAPTKALMEYLFLDMAKVKNGAADDFEIENVSITGEVMTDTLNSIVPVDYESRKIISPGVEISLHPAGHIIGAAMASLCIDGKTILYTGDFTDFSQGLASHLQYNLLPKNIDYLISEATYAGKSDIDWIRQSCILKEMLKKEISENKAVLLPAQSVGRSQELICLIGDMMLSGELPYGTKLCLGGMAVPISKSVRPFLNEKYTEILDKFEEFDGTNYPEEKSITVASSGVMSKGSASYRIAMYWKKYRIQHTIIMSGSMDEETEDETEIEFIGMVERCSLPTHASRNGILELVDYTLPKMLTFVHSGEKKDTVSSECIKKFNNDICIVDLEKNKSVKIFDLLKLMEENQI